MHTANTFRNIFFIFYGPRSATERRPPSFTDVRYTCRTCEVHNISQAFPEGLSSLSRRLRVTDVITLRLWSMTRGDVTSRCHISHDAVPCQRYATSLRWRCRSPEYKYDMKRWNLCRFWHVVSSAEFERTVSWWKINNTLRMQMQTSYTRQ